MQLYALDNDQFVFAHHAQKHKNYRCPECQNDIRIRGGPHRQTHFYHLGTNPLCNQHKKTLIHLQIQLKLYAQLPGSAIEKPYKQIHRIADVSWEQQGIVFEIQYSAISLVEAQERCRDYEKLGLTVVWILHEKRFNKRRMGNSEVFLRQNICYYTNIDAKGQGIIYDQFDISKNMIKLFWGLPLGVNLSSPLRLQRSHSTIKLPQALLSRFIPGRLYFKGDLIDKCLKNSSEEAFRSMTSLEKKIFKPASLRLFPSILGIVKNFYRTILRMALESLAREF
jgi:competence protein CoiA